MNYILRELFAYVTYWYHQHKQQRAITQQDISLFLRQFAILIAASISLVQACHLLKKTHEKIAMRGLILSIEKEVLAGKNLFTSLYPHKQYFGEMICRLISLGEQTGKLELILGMAADFHEKNLAVKKQLKQIFFYPCLLVLVMLLMLLCMFIFIIPKFAELFQSLPIKLPLFTRILFSISNKLPIIGLFGGTLIMLVYIYLNKKGIKDHHLQNILLKLPFIKQFYLKIALARFTRNFSITFAVGMPIKEALKISANAALHADLIIVVSKMIAQVNAGLQLHLAMEKLNYFPPMMIQMIKIGEESGMLVDMLKKTADLYETEIAQMTGRLTQLLEPLIMLVLGVLIGGLVIGMYLPIFKLGTAL